jgi:hypothetical protein
MLRKLAILKMRFNSGIACKWLIRTGSRKDAFTGALGDANTLHYLEPLVTFLV